VVDAIERALGGEAKSSDLRRMITAARSAINGLMARSSRRPSGLSAPSTTIAFVFAILTGVVH
jgi:hypothetical protein